VSSRGIGCFSFATSYNHFLLHSLLITAIPQSTLRFNISTREGKQVHSALSSSSLHTSVSCNTVQARRHKWRRAFPFLWESCACPELDYPPHEDGVSILPPLPFHSFTIHPQKHTGVSARTVKFAVFASSSSISNASDCFALPAIQSAFAQQVRCCSPSQKICHPHHFGISSGPILTRI